MKKFLLGSIVLLLLLAGLLEWRCQPRLRYLRYAAPVRGEAGYWRLVLDRKLVRFARSPVPGLWCQGKPGMVLDGGLGGLPPAARLIWQGITSDQVSALPESGWPGATIRMPFGTAVFCE